MKLHINAFVQLALHGNLCLLQKCLTELVGTGTKTDLHNLNKVYNYIQAINFNIAYGYFNETKRKFE